MTLVQSYENATQKADEILREYWGISSERLPVDVVAIARSHGIEVYNAVFTGKFNGSVDGMIRAKDGVVQILVNAENPSTRKRFTIAHELGHFFLHHNGEPLDFVDLRSGVSNFKEVEANKFATALLMPQNEVTNEYNKLLFPTGEELARIFNVSKVTMQIRLKELGLDAVDA